MQLNRQDAKIKAESWILSLRAKAASKSSIYRFIHIIRGIHARQNASSYGHWAMQDGLGTVRVETDNSVALEGAQNLGPFGNLIDLNGVIGMPYGLTGE